MKRIFITLSCLTGSLMWAQTNDSIPKSEVIELEQTVISGQYSNQSIKKSIYEVRVITEEMIERQAGNNLADVLNQTLNMTIIPSNSTGKSSVSMFGLDGQYFKILVDNIPLVNDEGLGSNTDLTQINLDDIQQIEIVEGAMGVDYGANAVAGIINVITKKGGKNLLDIRASVQEETIGNEYNWKNKGRHVQTLKIGHRISDRLYTELNFSRNDFRGYFNDKLGKEHAENDNKRGYEWLPKIQNSAKALIQYRHDNYRLFYKFEYFDEEVKRYSESVDMVNHIPTNTVRPTGSDAEFTTTRLYHHLNASGRLRNLFNYDVSLSYQEQKKKAKTYRYDILLDEEFNVKKDDFENRKVYYSKGLISNFINKNELIDFQFGYEINQVEGFASPISGDYRPQISNKLGTYDVFGSTEINLNKRFSLRPGARVMFSDQFDTQLVASLSARYDLGNEWEARAIVGTAPRLPNFDEMFSYFVDSNHNLQGNKDLKPEDGWSAFFHLKKRLNINELKNEQKFSVWTINLKDKIDLVEINATPLEYSYRNIGKYNTHGITYNTQFFWRNLQANAGISYTGVKQVLDEKVENASSKDDYLYTLQVNASASYQIPSTKTTFSVFYKFNGKEEQYVLRVKDNKESYLKGVKDSFSWMDASIRQSFFHRKMDITVGARNLFDVKRVNNSTQADGAHTASSSSILLGYGRSFFVKLVYHLNFN